MRLPVNRFQFLAGSLATLIVVEGGAAVARDRPALAPAAPVNGPSADYPVVVGEPFTIGSTVWTPTDQLNYDAVGQSDVGDASLVGVSAAHKTLPVPSYAEVTSLVTGRTILLRIEKRGPMVNDVLVELSPQAADQLGIAPGSKAPVRVRRVNPPEQERAMLRGGGRAPERIETPEGLLKVLRRKLADQSPLLPPPSTPPAMPKGPPPEVTMKPSAPVAPQAKAAVKPAPAPTPPPTPAPKAAPVPPKQPAAVQKTAMPPASPTGAQTAPRGALVVQVGAFSSEANARALAAKLGGRASAAGKFWRVRTGPYDNRGEAAAALEKVKRAGYTDARIQSAD